MNRNKRNIIKHPTTGEETQTLGKMVGMVDQYTVPSNVTSGQAWQKLEAKLYSVAIPEKSEIITLRPGHKTVTLRTLSARIATIAAILCILFTGSLLVYKFSAKITVSGHGERLYTQLPDGSVVTINSGSKISRRTFGWMQERVVYLEGEAFFEVTEGSRFTVITGSAQTRVLGTSFNIFARNRELRVKCSTGRVEVLTNSGDHAILNPGDYLVGTNDRILSKSQESDSRVEAWTKGEFYFHNEPLTNVLAEIERQFDITIESRAPGTRRYSGYFNDKNLDSALSLVCMPMQLNYKYINDRQVLIF